MLAVTLGKKRTFVERLVEIFEASELDADQMADIA